MALYKWIQWLYFHGLGGSATMEYSIVNKVPIIIDNTMGKYKQFFYEELSMLVEQTKRYKDLKTYLDSTSDMLPI